MLADQRRHCVLAIPHQVTEDDYYKGYYIPKGATIVGNTWYTKFITSLPGLSLIHTRGILHNSETFPDPFKFKPERFLNDERLNIQKSTATVAYGYGRRSVN